MFCFWGWFKQTPSEYFIFGSVFTNPFLVGYFHFLFHKPHEVFHLGGMVLKIQEAISFGEMQIQKIP